MQLNKNQNIIYLGLRRTLPESLKMLPGICWHCAGTKNALLGYLRNLSGEISVIIHADLISKRMVEAFASLQAVNSKLNFIFIGQSIDREVGPVALTHPRIMTIFESELDGLKNILMRRLNGDSVISRKRERTPVSSSAQLFCTSLGNDMRKPGTVLGEAQMHDFSRGGAKISFHAGALKLKEYFCLSYQDSEGKKVQIEAQIRWIKGLKKGVEIAGIQFIALST